MGTRGRRGGGFPPSTPAEQFMSGILTDSIALFTWDASVDGWAALPRWWESCSDRLVRREQLPIGTWPLGADISEQSHREAWAGCLALEALSCVIDLRGLVVILHNDASPTISALRKGSFGLQALQRVVHPADTSGPSSIQIGTVCTCPAWP